MTTLFLDTSSITFTLAIIKDNQLIYEKTSEYHNQLSDILVDSVSKACDGVNLDINEIDRMYVVNGPGSFTGIRIGLTFAKVWAFSLKKQLIPISKLEMMATLKDSSDLIVPLIDARRGYVYGAVYSKDGKNILKDQYISLTELTKFVNDYSKQNIMFIAEQPIDGVVTTKPAYDILTLVKRHENDKPVNVHSCNPNYLKRTEAEEKHDQTNQ